MTHATSQPPTYAILFRSVTTRLTEDQFADITRASVSANCRARITGLMLYGSDPVFAPDGTAGPFVQWMEGPRAAVRETFERICTDTRHVCCEILAEGWSADLVGENLRLFAHWSVALDVPGALPTTVAGVVRYARAYRERHGTNHPFRSTALYRAFGRAADRRSA